MHSYTSEFVCLLAYDKTVSIAAGVQWHHWIWAKTIWPCCSLCNEC